ncbi:MAG: T9SS type A sorting domain-containing protein, partial [Bacteroidota bacterium]
DCDGFIESVTSHTLSIQLATSNAQTVNNATVLLYSIFEGELVLQQEKPWNNTLLEFEALPEGNYILKVVPDPTTHPDLLVTYSGNALLRSEAAIFSLSSNMVYQLTVQVKETTTGNGVIEGVALLQEGNEGGRVARGLEEEGIPLANVPVFAELENSGKVAASAVSDASGRFRLEGLSKGNYNLKADYDGRAVDLAASKVEIKDEVNPIQVTVIIGDNGISTQVASVTGISEGLLARGISLYPNPIITQVVIETKESIAGVRIKIIDNVGRQVVSQNYSGKKQRFDVNMEHLSRGIYLINLSSNDGVANWKVVKN